MRSFFGEVAACIDKIKCINLTLLGFQILGRVCRNLQQRQMGRMWLGGLHVHRLALGHTKSLVTIPAATAVRSRRMRMRKWTTVRLTAAQAAEKGAREMRRMTTTRRMIATTGLATTTTLLGVVGRRRMVVVMMMMGAVALTHPKLSTW